ncbi:MAG TPA: protein translocase subunit SecF [Acidimicrobiales bacterium]|nr:protein translocase subunit SecF [Acidimicrobiales bacterium]
MTAPRRSVFGRLYHGETNVEFVGRTRLWFAISGVVLLIGLVSLGTQRLNLGIDFRGGTVWQVPARGVGVDEAREALRAVDQAGAKIQIVGSDTLRVQGEVKGKDDDARAEARNAVSAKLADVTDSALSDVSIDEVGPSWGKAITEKAVRALIVFLVAITIYITMRFEWKMALATLAALIHDVLITVGVYSLFRFEVTPATVVAFLTILGYSIYDGIVVFDKVEENTKGLASSGRMTYGAMVNLSLNQTLMRSLNTSITALLPISSLLIVGALILGATTLQDFALALLIGLASGAYSSIFIASPLLAILKEREPRFAQIKARIQAGGAAPLTPGGRGGVTTTVGATAASPPLRPGMGTGGQGMIQPRPRKKGRRR